MFKRSLRSIPKEIIKKKLVAHAKAESRALRPYVKRALAKHGRAGERVYLIDDDGKPAWVAISQQGNVISNESDCTIIAEIAGFNKDDISVEVNENVLSIVGKASQQTETTDKSVYLIRELKRSSFSRSFKLSEELDATNIDATFKDGLLKLVIPRKIKPKETTANKVPIK